MQSIFFHCQSSLSTILNENEKIKNNKKKRKTAANLCQRSEQEQCSSKMLFTIDYVKYVPA